jgi:hypothetical protein
VPEGRRVFTFEEAARLLPVVRERTREAVERVAAVKVPLEEADDLEARREKLERAAAEILKDWVEAIEGLGIEVKGPWLVDFDSGAGYYCWKWPEGALEYFHTYEEGFAGRVRLQ